MALTKKKGGRLIETLEANIELRSISKDDVWSIFVFRRERHLCSVANPHKTHIFMAKLLLLLMMMTHLDFHSDLALNGHHLRDGTSFFSASFQCYRVNPVSPYKGWRRPTETGAPYSASQRDFITTMDREMTAKDRHHHLSWMSSFILLLLVSCPAAVSLRKRPRLRRIKVGRYPPTPTSNASLAVLNSLTDVAGCNNHLLGLQRSEGR